MGRDPVTPSGRGLWWGQLPPLPRCFPRWGCLQSRVPQALGHVSRVRVLCTPGLGFLQVTRSRGGPALSVESGQGGLPRVRGPALLHPPGLKNEKPVASLPRSPQDCSELAGDRAVRPPGSCGRVCCRAWVSEVTSSSGQRPAGLLRRPPGGQTGWEVVYLKKF